MSTLWINNCDSYFIYIILFNSHTNHIKSAFPSENTVSKPSS